MKTIVKVIVSLIITFVICGLCVFLALSGGLKAVEVNYYRPHVIENIDNRLEKIGKAFDSYSDSLIKEFADYSDNPTIASYTERQPLDSAVKDRVNFTGILMERVPALEGLRLIEKEGRKIHFSTYRSDIRRSTEVLVSYSNYDTLNEIPYQNIKAEENACVRFDMSRGLIIYSLPFKDAQGLYFGTMAFYVNANDFVRFLVSENIITLSDRGFVISPKNSEETLSDVRNSGFIFDIPSVGRELIEEGVAEQWKNGIYTMEELYTTGNKETYSLLTGTDSKYAKVGWICSSSDFAFSGMERIVLLTAVFITVFLLVFLIMNLKHDDMVIIRDRVKKFQFAFMNEYLEKKDTASSWSSVISQVQMRRLDYSEQVKKSLGHLAKKHPDELKDILEESWNEISIGLTGKPAEALKDDGSSPELDKTALEHNEDDSSVVETLYGADDEIEELEELKEDENDSDEEDLPLLSGDEGEVNEADKAELEELPSDDEIEELEELDEGEEEFEELEEVSEAEKTSPSPVVIDASMLDAEREKAYEAERRELDECSEDSLEPYEKEKSEFEKEGDEIADSFQVTNLDAEEMARHNSSIFSRQIGEEALNGEEKEEDKKELLEGEGQDPKKE